ncbi:MAG: histidine kinase [Clostridia bacterium]|nr:histidine kinase [Clostridia bacterium]
MEFTSLTHFKPTLQFIASVLSLGMICLFLIKGRRTPLSLSYIWCQASIFLWSTSQMLEHYAANRETRWFFVVLNYTGVCFIGLAWLTFCLIYTGQRCADKKVNCLPLVFPPLVCYIMLLTNDFHHLFFTDIGVKHEVEGVFFWVNILVVYSYCLIGTIMLFKHAPRLSGYTRKQTILLILAMAIPFTTNVNYVFDIIQFEFDLTPSSFAFSLFFFTLATFKYQFLNVVPVAMREMTDNMKESIIMVDWMNKITYYNSSFVKDFGGYIQIGKVTDIRIVFEMLKEYTGNISVINRIISSIENLEQEYISVELELSGVENKHYVVNVRAILSKEKTILGKVISFNDVTEYKKLLREINEKNEELSMMNEQLAEYAATAEELAIVKERNRFARDIHDTMGHTMTLLISLLEVSGMTYKTNPTKAEEILAQALKTSRDGLKEVRRSISGLAPENLEANSLIKALENLISDFKASGLKIDFKVDGVENYKNTRYSGVIYRTCQEAITNSVRHGKAKCVFINLVFGEGKIRLFISDDGCGCKNINKGFGLHGMEQRIKGLEGSIIYGSKVEGGFEIRAEIPLE